MEDADDGGEGSEGMGSTFRRGRGLPPAQMFGRGRAMDSVQDVLARPPKISDLPPQSPAQRMRAHGRKEDVLAQQAEADEDAEERA